jgi:1-acyl-sn-glycerol-3-phosphate acyltransferase
MSPSGPDSDVRWWYWIAYALVWLFFHVWARGYRCIGAWHVPRKGGCFLVSNHASALDPVLLGYGIRHRMLGGPGKAELFRNPLLARVWRTIGMFPLKRGVSDLAGVRNMIAWYRRGRVVVVFPEGRRTDTGDLGPFNTGFTRLVLRLRAPVVPAAIAGAFELLPMGTLLPRHGVPVTVVIGAPIDLSNLLDRPLDQAIVDEATERIRAAVADLLNQAHNLRRELEPGLGASLSS